MMNVYHCVCAKRIEPFYVIAIRIILHLLHTHKTSTGYGIVKNYGLIFIFIMLLYIMFVIGKLYRYNTYIMFIICFFIVHNITTQRQRDTGIDT